MQISQCSFCRPWRSKSLMGRCLSHPVASRLRMVSFFVLMFPHAWLIEFRRIELLNAVTFIGVNSRERERARFVAQAVGLALIGRKGTWLSTSSGGVPPKCVMKKGFESCAGQRHVYPWSMHRLPFASMSGESVIT